MKALWVRIVIVFSVLVGLDLLTKQWVSSIFTLGQSKEVIPGFFNLTLVHNTGAAFGLGAAWGRSFFIVTSFLAIGVVGWLLVNLKSGERLSRWALVLILSGAAGNLVDRVRLGYVVDFFDVYLRTYHWPAFNVADSCITVGACLFAFDLLRGKRADRDTAGGRSHART